MREDADKLLAEALRLPLDEKAELVAALLASIDALWAAEIERRARRALAGETRGRPWREALARVARGRPR